MSGVLPSRRSAENLSTAPTKCVAPPPTGSRGHILKPVQLSTEAIPDQGCRWPARAQDPCARVRPALVLGLPCQEPTRGFICSGSMPNPYSPHAPASLVHMFGSPMDRVLPLLPELAPPRQARAPAKLWPQCQPGGRIVSEAPNQAKASYKKHRSTRQSRVTRPAH